jgi:deoxyribodipyrimidine photolyase-related protein
MVLANFALLAGIEPRQVSEWFLIVYADAYEWVETPNVIGMGLFADGGMMASKPYAAGGAYINRMSDYCRGCAYDVKKRTGEGACPFNSLYWDFLARNRELLGRNHRLLRMYDGWDRFDADEQARIRAQAAGFLAGL